MTCSYCGARNHGDETRCRRCGRKPEDSLTGEFILKWTDGALAAQAQPGVSPGPPAGPPPLRAIPGARQQNLANAIQGTLFWEKPEGKVIPIAAYTTSSAPPRPRAKSTPRAGNRTSTRRSRVPEEQGQLDFLPAAPAKPRTLGTTVEAVIYCEDPVAPRKHRAVAAAFDWAVVFIGYALFLTVFHFMGGRFVLTKVNFLMLAGVWPLLGCFYGLLFAAAGKETAGMVWTHLRLTTFEGFPPEPRERLMRFLGSCLSMCSVLGLLWSFADEESLAWSDHISRTFPTPRRVDSQVFHRK